MRNYELVLILDPQLGDSNFEGVITRYEEELTSTGGEVVNIDRWGLRKLAYTSISMKRRSQGYYVLYQFIGEPAQLGPLEERLKVEEDVLRHMVIAVPGEFLRIPQLAPEGEILGAARSARSSEGGRPAPSRAAAGGARPTDAAAGEGEKAGAAKESETETGGESGGAADAKQGAGSGDQEATAEAAKPTESAG